MNYTLKMMLKIYLETSMIKKEKQETRYLHRISDDVKEFWKGYKL